jgi:hypothetical protein
MRGLDPRIQAATPAGSVAANSLDARVKPAHERIAGHDRRFTAP